jgi:hypothetical protein
VNESNTKLDVDVRWAQVPEWVVTAPISDRAVRLYALLARRANSDSQAFPSRKYLAVNMHCSSKSVDRAMEELLDIGAVTKSKQFHDSRQTVNLYTLKAMGGTRVTRGGDTGDEGGGDTGVPQNESHKNESHITLAAAPKKESAKKDELFEAIAAACNIDWTELTRTGRGQLNTAAKELRDIGVTPEQVPPKAAAYRKRYPEAQLTPTALVKHWAGLQGGHVRRPNSRPQCDYCHQPLDDHDPQVCRDLGGFR